MDVVLIMAMSPSGVIGLEGKIPWRIPEDLARFRELTYGHTLVMGRRTYESLPVRPLPGRRTIVVSSHPIEGGARSVPAALELCRIEGETEVFVCGGKRIYEEAVKYATRIELTSVDSYQGPGDTIVNLSLDGWKEIGRMARNGYSFVSLVRETAMP